MLGAGVYTLPEASYLLGMDERTVLRWSQPQPNGKTALVPPTHGWAFSFHDLLSLAVIAVLRQRGVKAEGVRRTIHFLQAEFSVARPLAHRDIVKKLRTAGNSVLSVPNIDATRGGQFAFIETIALYLQPIEYGSDQLARLWKPASQVVLDPEIQAGRPCIQGTRVTTDVVAGRVTQGESRADVARDLGITVNQVTAARTFEKRLQHGEGLALVA